MNPQGLRRKNNKTNTKNSKVLKKKITIKQARNTIRDAFEKDPDFKRVYVDNVSCFLMDKVPGLKRNDMKRNKISTELIDYIFG